MSDPLVSTKWLHEHINDPDVRVIDAAYRMPAQRPPTTAEDHAAKHIPGAVFFDVDAIADQVTDGVLDISEGFTRLHNLRTQRTMRNRIRTTISYGIASAAVAAILHASWVDLAAAGAIGLFSGALAMVSDGRPRLSASFEAICALLATFAATQRPGKP